MEYTSHQQLSTKLESDFLLSSSVAEGQQFNQLQQLQEESNQDLVVEVLTLFFEDAERFLNELTIALSHESIAFKTLEAHVHQLKKVAPARKNQRSVLLLHMRRIMK
ncbi:hypothetical protein Lal_00047647 [Lupinus albus]|nr:hypothetical protein Lal_00047647 [Lupinus albus]